MKLKQYPEYKDSGVEWLGMVPDGWIVKPLLSVARERNESNRGMKEINLLSLSYGTIVNKDIDSNEGLLPDSFETYQIIHEGDIVFRLTDLQNDKRSLRTAIVEEKGIITSAYVAVYPQGIDSKFLNYLLRSYDTQKVFYSMGGGLRQSMKFSDIKRLPILIPEHKQQERIIFYLDRETAKLDTLIAKQEKLIELLQEKRQAIISHAVTKGLDPNVKMKDSGVEWLPLIPENWKTIPIKYTATNENSIFIDGDWIESKDISDSGFRYITTGNVGEGKYKEQGIGYISENKFYEIDCTEVMPGDLLISRLNLPIGRACLLPNLNSRVVTSVDNVILRPNENINRKYFVYFLSSKEYFAHTEILARGTTMQRISRTILGNIRVCLPPFDEQNIISKFLDRETDKLDNLIEKAKRSIELAKEHRTSLISAAVTGKIDVRDMV